LRLGEARKNGQREHLTRRRFGVREIPFPMSERREAFLQVKWHWIVDLRRDARLLEALAHAIAVRHSNDVLIENVVPAGRAGGQRHAPDEATLREERVVTIGVRATTVGPCGQMRQLDSQDGGLQRIEAEIPADAFVKILRLRAVIPQQTEVMREVRIAGRDEPAVAECTEVLAREKREAPDRAHRSSRLTPVGRANGLGGIFHDWHARPSRSREDRVHVSAESVEMDRQNRARARGDCRIDRGRIDVAGPGIDVDEPRRRAKTDDRSGRRENENAGVMTSSPGPIRSAISATISASVPDETPTAWPTPMEAASSCSSASTSGPPMNR
jgi:hypothetical protein